MTQKIRIALDAAGYDHAPATEDALIDCFLDYVAAGYWWDSAQLLDDFLCGDVSIDDICREFA